MRWQTLNGAPPQVIAHRGASGLLPEHTLEAYQLALEQGADIIEPDLVPSAEGILFARHDPGMSRSTDVASRPEFRGYQMEGDWPCNALEAAALDRLRATQPFPTRSQACNGAFGVPRWRDVLSWAGRAANERGRPVTLYPELKTPARFIASGVDPVTDFIESAASIPAGVIIMVQCFEAAALRRVHEATGLPCSLAVDATVDWHECLREHGPWITGLVADKRLLSSTSQGDDGLVHEAHCAGIRVDAWTFRDDQIGAGYTDVLAEMTAAMRAGVDGLFCDFPATALALRSQLSLASALAPTRPSGAM